MADIRHLPRPQDDAVNFGPRFSPNEENMFAMGSRFGLISIFPMIWRFLIIIGLSTSIEAIRSLEKEKKNSSEIEKQKAISELNFLRTQLNPHFLFNALNNIYALSKKKPYLTSSAILLLSKMLRYILYESNKNRVPLEKEIAFIKNHISLEKLKFSESSMPDIVFDVSMTSRDYLIEPLLLVTLVENAFKHGIACVSKPFVHMHLNQDKTGITFKVTNSFNPEIYKYADGDYRGIGIKNMIKRLELIYGQNYFFQQSVESDMFTSSLRIDKILN